jgi:hypothetical protein
MTTVDELQALVEERYAHLDAPTWDAVYDWEESWPPDEAYSRVTDPARYRIVHLRARVWADVLAERLDARVEPLGPYADPEHRSRVVVGGSRLVPTAPGARPLLLVEIEVPQRAGAPLPVLDVVLDRPGFVVGGWPDCGCDACDTGSADLLGAVDDSILTVVVGPYAMVRGDGWTAEWYPDGGGAGGDPAVDSDRLYALAQRVGRGESVVLPVGAQHVVSHGWLG